MDMQPNFNILRIQQAILNTDHSNISLAQWFLMSGSSHVDRAFSNYHFTRHICIAK